ncbi:MAG: tail fiber domain-containing protein, partial [Candidatus Paceibacterota bacterium]
MTILSNGNIGIGTTTPYAQLGVNGLVTASYFNADLITATSTFAGTVKLSDTTVPTLGNISAWGDSFTEQNSTASRSYPTRLSVMVGRTVFNGGHSGDTSSQMLTRFQARPDLWNDFTMVWIGQNDLDKGILPNAILDNVATLYSSLSNPKQFIVLGLTVRVSVGSASTTVLMSYNSSLQSTYPNSYVDINSALLSSCNPIGSINTTGWYASTTQDQIDCDLGKVPTSLRYDVEHLNDAGYSIVADVVYTKIKNIQGYWSTAISNASLASIFASPYNIGSIVPASGIFTTLTATSTTLSSVFAGKVGLGTTTPSTNLDIYSSNATPIKITRSTVANVNMQYGNGSYNIFTGLNTGGQFGIGTSADLTNAPFLFHPSTGAFNVNTNSFVVAQSNRVGIGTTSPFAKLSIHANANETNKTLFAIGSSTSAYATTTLFSIANTGDVTINGSGGTCVIGSGSGATMCSSDEQLKTNITVIPDALHNIEQIKGVTFNWADTTKNQNQFIGVIAQDVQKVFPQAVATLSDGYLAVDYGALVAPLIEAVKELAGKVNSLAATVAGLAQDFTS